MSRRFVNTSSEGLDGPVSTGLQPSNYPVFFAAWFNRDALGGPQELIVVNDGGANNARLAMATTGDDDVSCFARSDTGQQGGPQSGGAFAAGAWHHAAALFASTTSRTAYLDGSGGTPNTTTINFPTLNQTSLAYMPLFGELNFMDGMLAEVGIWEGVTPPQSMIDALANGASPLMFPFGLLSYWKLVGVHSPEIDLVGGNNLALKGTPTKDDHPRVIYPSRQIIFPPPAAGVPATVEVAVSETITLSPQGPAIRAGASVFSDIQVLTLQPQGPTVDAAVTTDIDVSDPLSVLMAVLDPTIQAGSTIRIADPADLVVQPQNPTIQVGSGIFVDPVSLNIQPQGPNIETGAAAIVEDPQGILLQPQGPLVSTGAIVSVSEAGVIRITVPGPTITASTAIGAEVEAPVCLVLSPIGPSIVAGAQGSRYSVHIGKGTAFSKGVRDNAYDVGDKGVSRDSEDFE